MKDNRNLKLNNDLLNGRVNAIKKRNIYINRFTVSIDGNQVFSSNCQKFVNLENSIQMNYNLFKKFQNLKHFLYFKLDIQTGNRVIAQQIKSFNRTQDIEIRRSLELKMETIKNIRYCFPNIRKLIKNHFSIECDWIQRTEFCGFCYEKLIDVFINLNKDSKVSVLLFENYC
jgi:hypothetical protein